MAGEIVIFITSPSREEAKRLGFHLVSEGLAACVNIVPGLISLFRWEGRLHEEKEFLLIVKTRTSSFKKLEKRVRELHSYSVPEVIGLPIVQGSKPYLQWVRAMTLPKKTMTRSHGSSRSKAEKVHKGNRD